MSTHNHLIMTNLDQEIRAQMFSANAEALVDVPFGGSLRAGFPSPAQDYTSEAINLGKILVRDNETTFYARVEGNSMCEAGICDGDLVVIDKSIEASEGDIVAAFIDGEFTLKRFHVDTNEGCAWLMPANADFKPIKVTEENNFMVWGVMTFCIRRFHE